jgi:rRNA maturation endonuclease Nob1
MTSLDPNEIKRVKVHPVKCSRCKLTVMVQLDDVVCPVCGGALLRPVQR